MDGEQEENTGSLVGALLTPFLAVLAITAVLTGLFAWLGPDPETDVLSAKVERTSQPAASATPAPTGSSAEPSTTATSPQTSPPASTSAPPEPPATSPPAERLQVVILNQGAGAGRASEAADLVREAGWDVFKTGDFRGTVRTTTVYHPAGMGKQARALAADLPGQPRVLERFSNLSETRLTIVLTDDYGS